MHYHYDNDKKQDTKSVLVTPLCTLLNPDAIFRSNSAVLLLVDSSSSLCNTPHHQSKHWRFFFHILTAVMSHTTTNIKGKEWTNIHFSSFSTIIMRWLRLLKICRLKSTIQAFLLLYHHHEVIKVAKNAILCHLAHLDGIIIIIIKYVYNKDFKSTRESLQQKLCLTKLPYCPQQ